jgi:LytTr DNA-binding domain
MQLEGMDGRIGGREWWARALSFAAIMGVLLGVLGPFGSYLNPMPLRILDQLVMNISGTLIAGVMIPLQLGLGRRYGLPLPFCLTIAIVITAIPIAALSALVSSLIWPWNLVHYNVSNWYFEALLMLASLLTLWVILEAARSGWRKAPPAPTDAPSAVGLVLCLQTEDNYVRVHRTRGSSLELMPLHEAIRRYVNADGLQVHRGWWVSSAAVAGVERDGRKWRLRLTNGLRAPVARNRVAEVRARGWITEP